MVSGLYIGSENFANTVATDIDGVEPEEYIVESSGRIRLVGCRSSLHHFSRRSLIFFFQCFFCATALHILAFAQTCPVRGKTAENCTRYLSALVAMVVYTTITMDTTYSFKLKLKDFTKKS